MRGIDFAGVVLPLVLTAAVGAHAQPGAAGQPALQIKGAATAAAPTAGNAAPRPNLESLQGNVVTVETLLKTENELALARAKEERVKAGLDLTPPRTVLKGNAPVQRATVEAIMGTPGHMRLFLTANGQRYENVAIGATVASCRIVAIQGKCVAFAPASQKVKQSQCPSACWTGLVAPTALAAGGPQLPGATPIPLPPGTPGGPLPAAGAIAPPR